MQAYKRNLKVLQKKDNQEQYSRRNSLRVSDIDETPNENTDDLIIKMSDAIGANIAVSEIDRSHRVGKPGPGKSMDILVKFVSYRSRQKIYTLRSLLKDKGYPKTFVNEDMTKRRSFILY